MLVELGEDVELKFLQHMKVNMISEIPASKFQYVTGVLSMANREYRRA